MLCGALAGPVFAFASRATQVIVVHKESNGSVSATCPKGEHVGFGGMIGQFRPPPNVPNLPSVFPEGMVRTAPGRWTVTGQSDTTGTGSQLTAVAYCDVGSLPSVTSQTVGLPVGRSVSATATCAAGTVLVGGGFKSGASPGHKELLSQLERVSPTQWRVTMRNISKSATTLTALAYCGTGVGPTLYSSTVPLASQRGGAAHASCPAGTLLVFGGLVAKSPGSGAVSADLEAFSFTAGSTKQWDVTAYNAGRLAGSLESLAYCR